jgi:hypothetical protein
LAFSPRTMLGSLNSLPCKGCEYLLITNRRFASKAGLQVLAVLSSQDLILLILREHPVIAKRRLISCLLCVEGSG